MLTPVRNLATQTSRGKGTASTAQRHEWSGKTRTTAQVAWLAAKRELTIIRATTRRAEELAVRLGRLGRPFGTSFYYWNNFLILFLTR